MAGPIANLTVRLSAQIAEFQSEFREAAKSTEKFQQEFTGMATKASALGNIIANGVTAAASGLRTLAESVLENASNITDLSQKTGLAMATIQQFQHVAEQTGTSVDAFTNAAFKLGTNLAGGGKSVQAAVEALGLSFAEIRKLSPDEQFNKIAQALSEMESPQERNRIALELFGRGAREIMPAIAEGYRDMANAARIASDEQIQSLDAAGDAWAKFKQDTITTATEVAGSAVLVGKAVKEAGLLDTLREIATSGVYAFSVLDARSQAFAATAKSVSTENKNVTASFDAQLEKLKANEDATKKAAAAADKYRESVRSLRDQLSGAALAAEVQKLSDATKSLTTEQKKNPAVVDRMADAAQELQKRGAALTPELFQLTIQTGKFYDELMRGVTGLDNLSRAFRSTDGAIQPTLDRLTEFIELMNDPNLSGVRGSDGLNLPGFSMGLSIPEMKEASTTLQDLSRGFFDLAQATTGTTSIVAGGLGQMLGAFDAWEKKALNSTQQVMAAVHGIANVFAATGGNQTPGQSALSGAFQGASAGAYYGIAGAAIGALAGAIIGAIRGVTEYEQRVRAAAQATRQLTQDAIDNAGGMQNLVAQFSVVGIQIDEAFKSRDPEFINKVLNEGYEKTRILSEALKEYGLTWENLGATGRAVHLGQAFDDLKAKTDVLKAAGVDYNLILEKQKGQYSELVQAAIRTGTEIPESMRPVLEDLLAMGQLVDENGQAFTDLSQISWAKTMTQGFADVTSAIDRLIALFTGNDGLNAQLDNLSRRRIRIPIGFDIDDLPNQPGGRSSVPVGGGSGFTSGATHTTIVEMDGEVVARATVPYIPGEMSRVGIS